MKGNVISAVLEIIAQYAAYAVSLGGFHQPTEPASLKKHASK